MLAVAVPYSVTALALRYAGLSQPPVVNPMNDFTGKLAASNALPSRETGMNRMHGHGQVIKS